LARYALNSEKLTPTALRVARDCGLEAVERNPFRSIIVRSIELIYACEEALRIIDDYEEPGAPHVAVPVQAGTGHGASEAPRGMLYHRYELDGGGLITNAQIVPPTAQNQLTIEDDLRTVLESHLALPDDELGWLLEQSIRNYDPCISCATHFLKLEIERT
jgi:coenzyme F420-reducing hydrogenase alpha subunit